MSNFNNPIPRSGTPRFHESSSQRSQRDSDAVGRSWRKSQAHAAQLQSIGQNVSQVQRQLDRLKLRKPQETSDNDMFPFKIYNFPKALRKFHSADDWRRIKVRGDGSSSFTVWPDVGLTRGTDEAIDPWSEQVLSLNEAPPSNGSTVAAFWREVVVPDGGPYSVIYETVLPTTGQLGIVDNVSTVGACLEVALNNTIIIETGEAFDNSLNPYDSPYRKTLGVVYANGGTLTIRQLSAGITDMSMPDQFAGLGTPDWFNPDVSVPAVKSPKRRLTRMRGIYTAAAYYWYGDIVYDDRDETNAFGDAGTHTYRYLSIYIAKDDVASVYWPSTMLGPMVGVAPLGNSPDPWFTLSRSKIA